MLTFRLSVVQSLPSGIRLAAGSWRAQPAPGTPSAKLSAGTRARARLRIANTELPNLLLGQFVVR